MCDKEREMTMTEVGADGIHVSVVPLAGGEISGAVTVREERRSVVSDTGEEDHGGGARDPT